MRGCWSPAQAWGFWFLRHMVPEEGKVCIGHWAVAGLSKASLSALTWLYVRHSERPHLGSDTIMGFRD